MKVAYPSWKIIFVFTMSSAITGGIFGVISAIESLIKHDFARESLPILDIIGLFFTFSLVLALGALVFYSAPAFITGCVAAILIYLRLNKYFIFLFIVAFAGCISVFFTNLIFNYDLPASIATVKKNSSFFSERDIFFFLAGSVAAIGSLVYVYRKI